MNRWFRAQLVVSGLTWVLAGCLDGGGESPLPEQPNPPQAINTPPVANAGTDQVVTPGSTVNLSGSGTDANGTIATYAWTQTAGAAVTLASDNTATPSFTAPATAGTLTFQLTVTDNGGASRSDTVTVTVNGLPVANAGADRTVSAGAAVSLTGTGSDADGTIASYAWTQTSGPGVTLSNANTATLSFTAPSSAASLGFSLTVTDDRGATHVDSVTVTVTAIINPPLPSSEPSIGRQPNNPLALEHGSAMMFVAASGGDLTYEWRRASGVVVKTGPEPFLLVSGLNLSHNNDCYHVVVSNTAGIATSEQGCLTVEEIDWDLDPSDDPNSGDDASYALGFGETLMRIVQTVTGPLTGITGGNVPVNFPLEYGPPRSCYLGSFGGTAIDGVMMSAYTLVPPPLGQHTLTESWDECFEHSDDLRPRNGAYLVEYDFPQTWGVGTLTIHVSDRYFNGTIHANIVANDVNGHRTDDIEITIADNFSAGDLKMTQDRSITIDRRYADGGQQVEDVYLDLGLSMQAFDADGSVGMLFVKQGGFFHLQQHFRDGDDSQPEYTSTGTMVVGLDTYVLAALEPSGGPYGWGFVTLMIDDCPEGYICADPPQFP